METADILQEQGKRHSISPTPVDPSRPYLREVQGSPIRHKIDYGHDETDKGALKSASVGTPQQGRRTRVK